MKTFTRLTLASVVGLLALNAAAGPTNGPGFYGGRVYYERIVGHYAGIGGEFTLRSDGGPGLLLSNAAYSTLTRGLGGWTESFQTFCVEAGEYIANPMDLWVSTAFVDGSQPGSHAWDGGTGAGDDLNPQTAYLYTLFAQGTLSNYSYLSNRSVSAGQLQKAIWFFEGEGVLGAGDTQAIAWVQEAVNATGLAFGGYTPSGDAWWGNTIGDVRVLQTYWGNRFKQDQLYLMVSAPGAVFLGTVGIALVTWLSVRHAGKKVSRGT